MLRLKQLVSNIKQMNNVYGYKQLMNEFLKKEMLKNEFIFILFTEDNLT